VISKPPPNNMDTPKLSSDAKRTERPPRMPIGRASQVIVAGLIHDIDSTIGFKVRSQIFLNFSNAIGLPMLPKSIKGLIVAAIISVIA